MAYGVTRLDLFWLIRQTCHALPTTKWSMWLVIQIIASNCSIIFKVLLDKTDSKWNVWVIIGYLVKENASQTWQLDSLQQLVNPDFHSYLFYRQLFVKFKLHTIARIRKIPWCHLEMRFILRCAYHCAWYIIKCHAVHWLNPLQMLYFGGRTTKLSNNVHFIKRHLYLNC